MDIKDAAQHNGFWYVATPYSKHPRGIEMAFREACEVCAWLIRKDIRVYGPIAHTHPIAIHGGIDPYAHKIWLPADKPFMDACCGLIVAKMDGWEESYGIRCEISEIVKQNKPIIYLEWPQE